jgi:endogenous inhibitor of DNA gyrase (YacG/DUF329 family)
VKSAAAKPPLMVRCPTCGHSAVFSPDNPWRPFCREQCKLIDLGQWAQERFSIPEPDANPPPSE